MKRLLTLSLLLFSADSFAAQDICYVLAIDKIQHEQMESKIVNNCTAGDVLWVVIGVGADTHNGGLYRQTNLIRARYCSFKHEIVIKGAFIDLGGPVITGAINQNTLQCILNDQGSQRTLNNTVKK